MPKSRTPLVIIDSREKAPWKFPLARTTVKCLQSYGYDYTLAGMQNIMGVERKSLQDFWHRVSTMRRWDKFCSGQLRKLAKLKHPIIIIEGNITTKLPYLDISQEACAERACEIIASFNIPVLFAGSRKAAQYAAFQFMTKCKNRYS